ncbi:hypothetical protein Tco_1425852 [Tanacetum coccineum]
MTNTTTDKSPIHSFLSLFLTIHPHETHTVFYSTSSFFFVLSAYFVVLPLRDEGAISLGIGNIPGLFAGSLLLTLVAAPISTLLFSLPNLPKPKVSCGFQLDDAPFPVPATVTFAKHRYDYRTVCVV